MGKSSINGQFSMAMLNNQRVIPKKTKQLSESEYSFPRKILEYWDQLGIQILLSRPEDPTPNTSTGKRMATSSHAVH